MLCIREFKGEEVLQPCGKTDGASWNLLSIAADAPVIIFGQFGMGKLVIHAAWVEGRLFGL